MRLTDLINASSGYLRVRDAQLRKRNGQPTNLVLPEMMIDQDEVAFIAQSQADRPEPGSATGFIEPNFNAAVETRQPRAFVMFTPGHIVTGKVHVFGATDLAGLRGLLRSSVRAGHRCHRAGRWLTRGVAWIVTISC